MASSVQELPEFTHTYTDPFGNTFDEGEYTRIFWATNPLQEYNKMLRERLDAAPALDEDEPAAVTEAAGDVPVPVI